jgi:TorA maturation chaperone TorD
MPEQHLTARQQRAIEYLMDNEGLTDNLTDDQAAPLLTWATAEAAAATAPGQPDEAADQALQAIRRAVLHAATQASGSHDADSLVLLAQQALARTQATTTRT